MALFRRSKQDEPEVDVDALVGAAIAERGATPTQVEPGVFVFDRDGTQHTITTATFAARYAGAPSREMPAAARAFVASVWPRNAAESAETLDDVRQQILPRVMPLEVGDPSMSARMLEAGYALSSDMVILGAIDRPESVQTVTDLSPYGGWEAVWPVAIANLKQLPLPATCYRAAASEAAPVFVFEDEDFFVATRVLVLDILLGAVGAPAPHGVLVAMPSRHRLAVHPVVDAAGIEAAWQSLARIASANEQANGPHVSYAVHYVAPGGAVEPASRVTEDQFLKFSPGDRLSQTLTDLSTAG